ncbi:ATP-binding protein [Maribacter confluentis]|uniref:histidine kinase n=1 Tax=Maribacter confluentis TaxID=1656093 RepID=A0ABT8RUN5_9FLAO|nr:ATP-binding protein [Maribacter confluentis]MDO1514139.1 ATP-binding protein [Maribacter confluentis]
MHSLIKRQLKKHLSDELQNNKEIANFLDAVDKSYENYDEKLSMMHRASTISSKELYEANQRLKEEADQQKNILNSLMEAIHSLTENLNEEQLFDHEKLNEFNAAYLAENISNLASKVSDMTAEKDKLLVSLEVQNQSLNNYAQMVSHDLKSPIRNINALMNWIMEDEKEKFSTNSKENCTLISQNLEKMDKLITGILNHATLGQTEELKVSFDLTETLKEIENTIFVPEHIVFEYADNLPNMYFERDRLEQLFMNLFTNAVTATEHVEKGIISIGYEHDEVYWKFSVTDNGKGIAKKHQDGLFQMFKKLETDNNATGIGLAIVKKIVVLYEGEVWLTSTENEGTTFYITLKKNS